MQFDKKMLPEQMNELLLDDFKCDNLNLEMLFCGILFNNYKINYLNALKETYLKIETRKQ